MKRRRSTPSKEAKKANVKTKKMRVVNILKDDGIHEIAVRDSREASKLSEYWETVHHFITTGDSRRLRIFRNKFITDIYGVRHPLLIDTDDLCRLANAGLEE